MISIYEINGWSDMAAFLAWTLAVCAIAKALFGSMPAAELQYRLSLRDAPRRQRMSRLHWEVNNRAKFDEDVARRSPHAAKQPLSDRELESRRAELRDLARTSLAWRAFTYFMGCFACQTFWISLFVFGASRGTGEPLGWVLSAAAYSGAAALATRLEGSRTAVRDVAVGQGPACRSCGK